MAMTSGHRQRGAALIVVLAVVLVAAMMAFEGLQRSLLAARVSGLAAERAIAFEAAESALRRGAAQRERLARAPMVPDPRMDPAAWRAVLLRDGTPVSLEADHALHEPPRVVVERTQSGHRLTVFARGPRARAEVILQVRLVDDSPSRLWRRLR
jgi:type IV pilus assembly protein PilX